MSWDITIGDLPRDAKTPSDIPKDHKSKPIGTRAEVIEKIRTLFQEADFSDPTYGIIDGSDFSICLNMRDEPVVYISLEVRGSDRAMDAVAAIIEVLGVRGVDAQTGEFFDAGPAALQSFRTWRAFRDQAMEDMGLQ